MTNPEEPTAISIDVNERDFILLLKDGREFRIPWRWFPRLLAATPDQRNDVRVSASGAELHWDQLHENIRVSGLMRDYEPLLLEETLSLQVPNDFPWETTPASLAGAQPKLAVRSIGGRFVVGLTAAERFERWDMCEDLAQQLVPKTLKDAAKYPENSREVTLRRMKRAIEGKQWTSVVETDWLLERLRTLLNW
ncbi:MULTISPECIES: DUF2442 domain-containing protein [Paraburkholderia]|uniref:DUF2442 domain-containing protein n=1 Tax=Paraburkholderia dioscoreae TaxID=2604047 RepID=A0A5Q4ZBC0_9BURK|nr:MULTISPECIES: DUF2442 domain-containing protein [Paraburkholderia]MDR8397127.1 DUF2442 domain-containing protein [Paraburkholderia sp. USG1]VVD27484.1 conserved protein of unknown function [Paraburkholderia dioscoreae]